MEKVERELQNDPIAPKVLMFDLGHVFLDGKYREIFQSSLELGLTIEQARQAFSITAYFDFSRGKIGAHAYCEALRKTLNTPGISDDQIHAIHDKHIIGLVPGIVDILQKVTEKFGKNNIVFVTDTCDWQTERQQQLIDLSSYQIISSNEVGMLKADPEVITPDGNRTSFFLYVMQRLNFYPHESLVIDDNPENITIARSYGIQTIQFLNSKQLESELKRRNILNDSIMQP